MRSPRGSQVLRTHIAGHHSLDLHPNAVLLGIDLPDLAPNEPANLQVQVPRVHRQGVNTLLNGNEHQAAIRQHAGHPPENHGTFLRMAAELRPRLLRHRTGGQHNPPSPGITIKNLRFNPVINTQD